MKVLFVAKHRSGGNDDEGAVTYALRQLGCEVIEIPEANGRDVIGQNADFVLFFKWTDTETMKQIKLPKVCWYFDKVRFGSREPVFKRVLEQVDLMLMTDGEYARTLDTDKVHVLRQGIDERTAKIKELRQPFFSRVGFVGQVYGGRAETIRVLTQKYDKEFSIYSRFYRDQLPGLFSKIPVLIAPQEPSNDYYWSNRVYITLGHGGFLLHPYCAELAKEYETNQELVFYETPQDLIEKIDYFLQHPEHREAIRQAGYQKTHSHYSYTKRCQTLLSIVQSHIGKSA